MDDDADLTGVWLGTSVIGCGLLVLLGWGILKLVRYRRDQGAHDEFETGLERGGKKTKDDFIAEST